MLLQAFVNYANDSFVCTSLIERSLNWHIIVAKTVRFSASSNKPALCGNHAGSSQLDNTCLLSD